MKLTPLVPSEMNPPINTTLVTDSDGLKKVADFFSRVKVFGFDIETNCVDNFVERKIRTIQVGDRNEQYVIDLLAFAPPCGLAASQGNFGVSAQGYYTEVIDTLRPALESGEYLKVGTHLQFDYETSFWNLGLRVWNFYDCHLAERVLYAGEVNFHVTGFWALDDFVARYCGLEVSKELQTSFDLATPLTEDQITYCGLDARLPLPIMAAQSRRIESEGLSETAKIEFDAIPAFGDMHLFGIKIDPEPWMDLYRQVEERQKFIVKALDVLFIPMVGTKNITEKDKTDLLAMETVWSTHPKKSPEDKHLRKEARLAFIAKRQEVNGKAKLADQCEGEALINYGSNKQLRDTLLKMGFSAAKLKDTNDKTLEKLAEYKTLEVDTAFQQDPTLMVFPVIDLIRLHRSTNKLMLSYGEKWIKTYTQGGYINQYTGRIHSDIDQLGAATGRTTSSKPNIQNLPRDKYRRACFISGEGFKIATIDMSGAELRILAELSGEPAWIEAFANGWDVHCIGASQAFKDAWIAGTEPGCAFVATKKKCECKYHKDLRDNKAKVINFKKAYGGEPGPDEIGIARIDSNGQPVSEAKRKEETRAILAAYDATIPTAVKYLEKSGQDAATYLEARTMVGRRRKWLRPSWDDAKRRAAEWCKKEGKLLTEDIVKSKYVGMRRAIEREGKNAPVQGTNADFIKKAMGCGFDNEGKPFLWHILWPIYKAMMVNVVHDELVCETLDGVAQEVKEAVGDAFVRAAALYMHKVKMEWEAKIGNVWLK